MNELEKYIRAHAAEFDAAEAPQGHEERFLAAVEAGALNGRGRFLRSARNDRGGFGRNDRGGFARNDKEGFARNDRGGCGRNGRGAAGEGAAVGVWGWGAAGVWDWGAWGMLAGAVAVLVVAAVVLLRPAEGRGYFFGVGNDPEKVYLAYLDRVEDARLALAEREEYNYEGLLRGMTEEAVPLIEQLPEELSGRQQARILKQYYGEILAGVDKLKKVK